MSLIRIELQGFKSFRDKTVINFEHGYTGIVGPNGCGKSNVSDAIRWVLGERSAKQLRGENMKSVIFAGTASLPEMNYAEVTLVFDNSDKIFRTNLEQIAITRKVFRSKPDNYYYINHVQCHLSDILDLLRDTGAGKESLSIIEQGAVSEIMKVKPEERRRIFDEAAGVALSKEEKRKHLRSLELTNEKMNYVQFTLEELEKQMGPLQKQVEAYNKYLAYYEELRVLEYNTYIYKYETADGAVEECKAHIRDFSEYIETNSREIEKSKAKLQEFKNEIEATDNRWHALQEQRESLKESRARASGDQQAYAAKLETIQFTIDNLKEAYAAAIEKRDETAIDGEEAQNVLDSKKQSKFDMEIEMTVVSSELEAIERELLADEENIETATSDRFNIMSRLSEVSSEQAKAETERNILQENLVTIEKENGECRTSIEESQAQCRSIEQQQNELGKQNEQINAERSKRIGIANESRFNRSEVSRALHDAELELESKKINVQTLRNNIREKNGYSKPVAFLMNYAKNHPEVQAHIEGVVMDKYTVKDEYAEAISVCLGAAVSHIITRTSDDANALINVVRKAGVGRITCLPINRVKGETLAYEYRGCLREDGVLGLAVDMVSFDPKYNDIFQRLLGRIVVVRDFEVGKRLDARYHQGVKMVTLDGKVFDPSGSIMGGSARTLDEINLERELKVLAELKTKYDDLYAKNEQLNKTIEECDAFLGESRDKQDELSRSYGELNSKKEALQATITHMQSRIKDNEATRAYILARLAKLEINISAAQSSGDEIKNSTLSSREKMEAAKANRISNQAMRDSLAVKKQALGVALAALDSEIGNIEKDIARFKSENLQAVGTITGLESDLAQKQVELEQHVAGKPTLVFTEEENRILDKINADIETCKTRKGELQEVTDKLSLTIDDMTQRVSMVAVDRTKEEGKIERIHTELEQWTQRIQEEYGMGYEDIKHTKLDNFEHAKAGAQITVLRTAIKRMGGVNPDANAEYERIKADYDEKQAQLNDALQAKANLEETIQRITEAVNLQFKEAFDRINVNFQNTFSDLFGGGTAELLMVPNELDPDEEGVDISVQLPGKGKGPLTRLSGGEQSLTAIAILFAILKLKPMPFVVLDEVESALDEVNCNRFARFLRRYANTSKFIVITHKKPSMESADVLYGVTMQQPGVSSIVSVSLTDAVKHVWED